MGIHGIKFTLVSALCFLGSAGISRADAGRFVPDVSYLGPHSEPKLDLYVPAFDANGPLLPALVWIHGNNQTKDTARAQDFCGILAAEGYGLDAATR